MSAERLDNTPAPAIQRSLLRAALLERDAAWAAWEIVRTQLGRDELDATWLLPLVYRNLRGRLEAGDLARLKGVYRRTWYVNQLKRRELVDLARALETRGIPVLFIGGLPLALIYYGGLGFRPIADSQVVIRTGDAAAAAGVLESLGWRFRGLGRFARLRSGLPHWWLTNPNGGMLSVLCRRASTAPLRSAWKQYGDEFTDSVRYSLDGVAVFVRAPPGQLIDTLVRESRRGSPDAQSLADASMILRASADAIDWRDFTAAARHQRLSVSLNRILSYLITELEIQVPVDLAREVTSSGIS